MIYVALERDVIETTRPSDVCQTFRTGRLRAYLFGLRIPAWLGVLLATGRLDYVH